MLRHKKANAIGIIVDRIITLFGVIPRSVYAISAFIATILTIFSALFDYKKASYSNFIASINWYNIIIILLCAIIILLFIGFLKYIIESEDILYFTLEQKKRQALFLNDSIIPNLICELENYIFIKQCSFINEYLYTTGMKLTDPKGIEITAKTNGYNINNRMIFEVMRKKPIEDTYAYDPLGLAIVDSVAPGSFKSILIDTNPCGSYWEQVFKNLKKAEMKNEDIYLKIYVPTQIKYSNEETLKGIFNQLSKL